MCGSLMQEKAIINKNKLNSLHFDRKLFCVVCVAVLCWFGLFFSQEVIFPFGVGRIFYGAGGIYCVCMTHCSSPLAVFSFF